MRDDDRLGILTGAVRQALQRDSLRVAAWRSGVDFWADMLFDGDAAIGVLRSPRHERLDTQYDGVVDFGEVIEREVAALAEMADGGVPVPRVLAWRRAGDPGPVSWVLQTHIPHDEGATVPGAEFGRLTRRLHAITPDTPPLRPPRSWSDFVWSRLRQRLEAAGRYCPDLDLDLDLAALARAAEVVRHRDSHARSLLHMDLRASNVCVRDGRIEAFIDTANCLVGDPLMELARVRAYGLLDEAFVRGYGTDVDLDDQQTARLLDIYELDATALLVVVAVEEIDDPQLFASQRARTVTLAGSIVDAG
ncbi:hypothetical protein GCM10009682_00240 [Luedemannella flava]|uniref:Aminoglycoside phosphotransferase domain-containing protein n=1 Tax=Luedemannella flava TaxID=349316 RepID=A0ABP4XMK5_9ACTN